MKPTNDNSDTSNRPENRADKALLPAGMSDVLPPDAAFEAAIAEQVMAEFGANGYDRVKPPLLEFEQNLLHGPGTSMAEQTFRLMDPESQRMMGLRADMTPQVARIATTRLRNSPRPLRLSYSGQILRVKGTQLRANRQFGQVGAELIGTETPLGDTELILMATSALSNLGITDMSVDLCLPTLVPALAKDLGISQDNLNNLRDVLDRKDAGDIARMSDTIGAENTELFAKLLAATGPAEGALVALDQLGLGGTAKAECDTLHAIVSAINEQAPELPLTVDLVENRGWEYHTGVTFTFFSRGGRGELGTGGRYITDEGEAASGLTLFMDTVLHKISERPKINRIFLPLGCPKNIGTQYRSEDWVTVQGFEDVTDQQAEAKRLNCSHIYDNGEAKSLS